MSELYNCKFILSIVNSAIHEGTGCNQDYSEVDWEDVYQIGMRNNLIPLLYDHVHKLSMEYKISEALMQYWKKTTLRSMLLEVHKYSALRKILDRAKECNIVCIIFKGCVLANLYPKHTARASCDTDILVLQRDRERAIELFESLGYRKDEHSSKELVYVYVLDAMRHVVELHFSLWEDYKGAKIDLIDGMNLANEDSLVKIKACGMEITTLGYTQHLIYQMFHIIKHFSLQGVSIRYLVDITLYLNAYIEYIDLNDFWNKMVVLRYDKFCENFFNICVQHLEMSPKVLEDRKIRVTEDTEKFILDLIHVGTIFDDKTAGWQLLGIITPYLVGQQDIPNSKFKRQMKILFPASKDLPDEYVYARKHKILLPIAWIHKCVYFLIKRRKHKGDWYDVKEKLTVAEHRLSLMKSLGLVDGGKS